MVWRDWRAKELISSFFFFFPYKQARDPWEVALRALQVLRPNSGYAMEATLPGRNPTVASQWWSCGLHARRDSAQPNANCFSTA
jgi:hypothetical protein